MGWVWKDEADDVAGIDNANPSLTERCSTRKIVQSQCRTEEIEPGKFVRKCEKTEQILRDCVGRPSEVVQSNKEYTEEDVSVQGNKGFFPLESSDRRQFDFPGLRSDIEAIERSFFGGLSRFFDAAEEMKSGFFDVFGTPHLYDEDSSSRRQGVPIDPHPDKQDSPKLGNSESGQIDISGSSRDV